MGRNTNLRGSLTATRGQGLAGGEDFPRKEVLYYLGKHRNPNPVFSSGEQHIAVSVVGKEDLRNVLPTERYV